MRLKIPSLKAKLLLQLAIPLLLFMTIESVLSYFVTLHYVNGAYDRWLLDSARSLAQEIKVRNGSVAVELPTAALEIFKWDDQDKTYFKIVSVQHGLIAGDKGVPDISNPDIDWSQPVFFNNEMYGESVRVVAMSLTRETTPEKFYVSVAETLNKRRSMMHDILFADLFPQSFLLLGIGLYLLTGIQRGLKPLHNLADEIAKRSSRDLRPIPNTHVVLEVQSLIHTINDLFGRLNLAIGTQERFISNAAHQLRTPLAGLKLQAERAMREQDIEAMLPALLNIQNSADRLSHLTSQLLVLARSESNQHSYELLPLDLGKLTRDICIEWVPKALERKIELTFESSDYPIMILADQVLFSELIANLLNNAVTYGFEHGNIWIEVRSWPHIQLIVADDGPGIPEHEIDKILERFYRLPGTAGIGCGLGLAIVKEIADLHHAQLTLERSSHEGGLRITLTFH